MRAILLVLMLVVAAFTAAVASGYLKINQTRPAQAPQVSTQNGVSAEGGQAPAFDVETGSVRVEVQDRKVKVPTLQVEPAGGNAAQNSN